MKGNGDPILMAYMWFVVAICVICALAVLGYGLGW
jgi:hypothetical protein